MLSRCMLKWQQSEIHEQIRDKATNKMYFVVIWGICCTWGLHWAHIICYHHYCEATPESSHRRRHLYCFCAGVPISYGKSHPSIFVASSYLNRTYRIMVSRANIALSWEQNVLGISLYSFFKLVIIMLTKCFPLRRSSFLWSRMIKQGQVQLCQVRSILNDIELLWSKFYKVRPPINQLCIPLLRILDWSCPALFSVLASSIGCFI